MAKQITTSQILTDLQNGMTRKQIKEKYGLSLREQRVLFSHPKLKNKKTIKGLSFELVDDVNSVEEEVDNNAGEDIEITEDDPEPAEEENNLDPEL
jgi:hypothetical protein